MVTKTGIEMVLLPGGSSSWATTEGEEDEKPAHESS